MAVRVDFVQIKIYEFVGGPMVSSESDLERDIPTEMQPHEPACEGHRGIIQDGFRPPAVHYLKKLLGILSWAPRRRRCRGSSPLVMLPGQD